MCIRDRVTLFTDNGEGRFARRIARAIIAARPVLTTGQLADVVRTAIPAATRRTGGHPARRVFQAIRIAVNEELDQLETALDDALALLCLLYTSDAADEEDSVDLGGRRI